MSPSRIPVDQHRRAPVKTIVLRDDARQRFMSKFNEVDGCWVWKSATPSGYGVFCQGQERYAAHRVSYTLFRGDVPADRQIDHLCRNRACVNPEHLELVDNRENVARAPWTAIDLQAAKTHCPQGHPYDETNTYHHDGERHCRACRREAARRQRDRKNPTRQRRTRRATYPLRGDAS